MGNITARVAIVGGGLAGLVAARQLAQQGERDIVLFEARPTLGGRILSVDVQGAPVDLATEGLDRFDLCPSWFWPAMQPQLDRLVAELGLPRFQQFEAGDMLLERSTRLAPVRMPGHASEPASMRLAGGTGALITALSHQVDPAVLRTSHRVCGLRRTESHVELTVEAASRPAALYRVEQVLLALPPRLAATHLAWDPPLPPELRSRWQATPTWMAPHAKYVALYERPFWRAQGLSGGARSSVGPMGEIHDVSMPGGHAALFGFLGVPRAVRQQLGHETLRAQCRAQLGRLFGAAAARPRADALKDWAADPCTATEADEAATGHHQAAPPARADSGPWQGCLIGIASEWSPQFPGYLAGAVDAAQRGVERGVQGRVQGGGPGAASRSPQPAPGQANSA